MLAEFGGQPIATITTAQVERWLARLDEQPNAVRRPDQYGIQTNVARATSKRREPDPAVLDFYEPEEVAALARAARAGAHRDPSRPASAATEREGRRRAADQDAAPVVVAAFTGLRMGELLELRWRQPSPSRRPGAAARSPHPSRASRAPSRPPLRPPPSSRASPTAPGSLAPTTSSSAARTANTSTPPRSAAGYAEPSTQPGRGRFHDLRHSFGSLVVREVDTATLKAWMGHAKLTTTERYLHAKPRHTDVVRLDRAIRSAAGADAG